MQVTREYDGPSSHIEPPMKQDWPEIQKLEWWAAVQELDTGIELTLYAHPDGTYQVSAFGDGTSYNYGGLEFYGAWHAITFLGAGFYLGREVFEDQDLLRGAALVRQLCDKWDALSKGESATTAAIRRALNGEDIEDGLEQSAGEGGQGLE